jgi:hypothetical protein
MDVPPNLGFFVGFEITKPPPHIFEGYESNDMKTFL